jgi:hypothetical protein
MKINMDVSIQQHEANLSLQGRSGQFEHFLKTYVMMTKVL